MWADGNVETRAKSAILISDPKNLTGDTFYVGSLKKRRKLLRVYDKAKEQRVDRDWIRFEMQWGSGAARSASQQIAETTSLSSTIRSQMRGFADFSHPVWEKVFSDSQQMNVSHQMPTGLSNRMRWLLETVVPALTTQEHETPGIADLMARMVHENIDRENKQERKYID